MTKKAIFLASVLAIMTATMSSCQEKPIVNPDLPAVATTRMTASLWVEGSFEAMYADEEEETTVTSEAAAADVPAVTPADKVYEVYPMKIVYPEKRSSLASVTVETAQEDVYTPGGKHAGEFTAEYPVISGIDEDVCQKINTEIKLFIDRVFDEFRENTRRAEEVSYEPMYSWRINMSGTDFAGDGYDINGNIFTVYFADNRYAAPAAHGSESPTPMIFDLRTGDRIYFSDLIEDSDGLAKTLEAWFNDYQFAYGSAPYGMMDAEQYADILKNRNGGISGNEFGQSDDGVFLAAGSDGDERMTVCNGCVGFYLAAYEYGSFADGIRRVDVPANDVLPYLNDKGRSLFEGYLSAESVPANVIEYKGEKYFDTTMWVPNVVNENAPTDGDVEFISLFEIAWKHYNKLYGSEQN